MILHMLDATGESYLISDFASKPTISAKKFRFLQNLIK